jgi:DNA-binding transcriptional MerR regulator
VPISCHRAGINENQHLAKELPDSTMNEGAMVLSNIAKEKLPDFWVVYTIAEAARLCGLSSAQVRRWIQSSSHVVQTPWRGAMRLDFLDVIELRCVKAFLEAGVSWHALRAVHEQATALLQVDHPFSTKKFFTDGYAILTRIAEPAFLEVVKDRRGFSRMVNRYLAGEEGLDFDAGGVALRWWPMGRKRLVLIDPERSFGQPIASIEGVPTEVLYKAYLVERSNARNGKARNGAKPASIVRVNRSKLEPKNPLDEAALARVANWYVVEERSVRAAIEYESDFLADA